MRPLAIAAWTNVGLHATGLVLALFFMRPATPIFPLAERAARLAASPLGWQLGWAAWALCALALVTFFSLLERHLSGASGRVAFGFGVAAASVDLACDTVQAFVLPLLAKDPGVVYLAVERGASAGGLVPANGLYTLAVLAATVGFHGRGDVPKHVLVLGWVTVAFGLGMVVAGLVNEPRLIEAVTGPVMIAYGAWCVTTAHALEHAS